MRRNNNQGFTLVEVMTAMAILVIGMSTVLGLLSFGLSLHRSSKERAQAGLALDTVLSELETKLFLPEKGKDAVEPKDIQQQPISGYPGLSYSARFRENPKLAGEYLAEIEIAWQEKGKRRFQMFRTLMVQEIPFQERMKQIVNR